MNDQNLIPFTERTESERRELAIRAGKKSGIVRQKKREVTEIYGHWLAAQHDVDMYDEDGKPIVKQMSGAGLINYVMGKIIQKGNKESVMMIAEIRKAREGTTYHIDGGAVDEDLQATSAEVLKAEFEAELAKRDKILSARKVEALPEDAAPGQVVGVEIIDESRAVELQQAAQPLPQEATQGTTRQEVVKGDDTIRP